jgi:hypothetical protein
MSLARSRSKQRATVALAAAFVVLAAVPPSRAQTAQTETLRLTVNHAEVLTTDGTASSVVVANPDIADIVHEKPNLIFVFGRKPGATNLFAFDDSGRRLISREVVVVPDTQRQVTVTRVSATEIDVTDYYCEPRCVFFDRQEMVSSTTTTSPGATAGGPGAAAASGGAAAGAAPGSLPGTQGGTTGVPSAGGTSANGIPSALLQPGASGASLYRPPGQ